jgi:predicted DNA-binding transcriptional regulator AlpA
MEKLIIGMADLAELLGVTERLIYKYRCGHSQNPILRNLPEPISMRPMRWHRQDVIDWLDSKRTFGKSSRPEGGMVGSAAPLPVQQASRPRGRPRKIAVARKERT